MHSPGTGAVPTVPSGDAPRHLATRHNACATHPLHLLAGLGPCPALRRRGLPVESSARTGPLHVRPQPSSLQNTPRPLVRPTTAHNVCICHAWSARRQQSSNCGRTDQWRTVPRWPAPGRWLGPKGQRCASGHGSGGLRPHKRSVKRARELKSSHSSHPSPGPGRRELRGRRVLPRLGPVPTTDRVPPSSSGLQRRARALLSCCVLGTTSHAVPAVTGTGPQRRRARTGPLTRGADRTPSCCDRPIGPPAGPVPRRRGGCRACSRWTGSPAASAG